MTENNENAATRFRMLDLVRGVTVFLMLAAHSIYFFHNDTNVFLSLAEKFGNTVAFTVFLIVSAATAEIAYFSREEIWPEKKKRLKKRIKILALGYFALAFMVFFAKIVSTHGLARIGLILNIVTLRDLAPFAEFFIPFIVIPLVIAAFSEFFRRLVKSIPWAIVFGFAVYFLGLLLYQVPVWDFLTPWKALLFGAPGYYRFPIFEYFPIYLLGLVWGNRLLLVKNLKHQKEMAQAVLTVTSSGIVLTVIGFLLTNSSMDAIIKRWPPSIPFLLCGVFFAALLALIFYVTKQLQKTPLLRDGLLVLGQNALGLALMHVFLLQVYSLSGGLKTGSVFLYLFSFLVLLVLALALAAIIPFNFRFALNLDRGHYNERQLEEEALVQFEEEVTEDFEADVSKIKRYFFIGPRRKNASPRLIKKRHLLGASLTLALAAFVIFPPLAEEYQLSRANSNAVRWDNAEYGWRQNLTIKNNETLAEIPKDDTVSFQFDHASLIAAKKAYPDGRDLLVRYWDGKNYQSVRFWLASGLGQANATIGIELRERLKPGDTTGKYYLYYGNNLAESNAEKTKPLNLTKVQHGTQSIAEENYPILLTVDRRWSLISDNAEVPKTLRIALATAENFSTTEAEYAISGTAIRGKLEKTADGMWEGTVPVKGLKPGQYQINAQIENNGETYTSSKAGFFVSYPLYIAWTQDWEGYDVPDNYLAAITQVAREHDLKMTHFWNPRLLTTDTVSAGRKEALLAWIKNRRDSFDESIQLHLHMFSDFVSLAGVTPKNSPNWGDSGDGYGALTTNYDANEMTKIIGKALEIMRANGFDPKIYRAGGWFANADTLKAVENAGMAADSSGRTAYNFYSQKGPWDLLPTAQPYYPSAANPNKTDGPTLSILEIPNNGADSYWFSTEEMKNRFWQNYSGGILNEPRQITYLSHPHWFNKAEQNKIEEVFGVVDQFKYDSDSGPALYVTLEEIFEVWSER